MGSTDLALSWKDHHGVLFNVFEKLLAKKSLVDCTLAAEGKFLKAHRIVLSACSPYFEALLDQEYDKHPIIFLRDVQFEDLKTLLEFVYSGEIKIPENRLVEFLNVAEALQIKGLGGVGNEGQVNKSSADALPSKEARSPVPRKRSRRHSSSSDSSSRDRAEIIPVSAESSRPKSSTENIVPVTNNASVSQPVPRQSSVVPSEDLNPNVKVKEEIITPVQSTCSDQLGSDHSGENEEILGLKPEFEQVTFTEDYSDDMLPEDSDSVDHVIDQDQPSSSQQYSGFSAESVKPGELSIHPPFAVGGVNQPVPEAAAAAAAFGALLGVDFGQLEQAATSEVLIRRRRGRPPSRLPSFGRSAGVVPAAAHVFRRPGVSATRSMAPHPCGQCSRAFYTASELRSHARTHTGERPFRCHVCRSAFSQKGTLQRHLRTHTGEKPFRCSRCGGRFTRRTGLAMHKCPYPHSQPHAYPVASLPFTIASSACGKGNGVNITNT